MLRKAGIVRRTFVFVALLIVIVTLVSFAILYFALPPFYLRTKERSLQKGAGQLEEELKLSGTEEECALLIAGFTEEYNVTVSTFGPDGKPIAQLSSPFVSMPGHEVGQGTIIINGQSASQEDFSSALQQIYLFLQPMEEGTAKVTVTDESVEAMETIITYETGESITFDAEIGSALISRLRVQGTLQPIEEARGVIFSLIPYALAAGSAIGLCLAWIYARQISKPILKLSATAVSMKNMEPGAVSGIKTNDEVGLLSENLDALYHTLSETIGSLKTEMEKVNRLEQSKTEMMQSASHELKTPVAALSGMLDGMIDNIGVYRDKEKYLQKCKDQVEKLSYLVKEILDASRADISSAPDQQTDTRIDEILGHILEEYEELIRNRSLQVSTAISAVRIRTDADLLYRAAANLVGNAVMYTSEGGIIHLLLSEEELSIENTCLPIPAEELSRLFEPFYTRSSSRDRTENGTGLGLYIVKRNLERLSIPYQAENTTAGFKVTLYIDGVGMK